MGENIDDCLKIRFHTGGNIVGLVSIVNSRR